NRFANGSGVSDCIVLLASRRLSQFREGLPRLHSEIRPPRNGGGGHTQSGRRLSSAWRNPESAHHARSRPRNVSVAVESTGLSLHEGQNPVHRKALHGSARALSATRANEAS